MEQTADEAINCVVGKLIKMFTNTTSGSLLFVYSSLIVITNEAGVLNKQDLHNNEITYPQSCIKYTRQLIKSMTTEECNVLILVIRDFVRYLHVLDCSSKIWVHGTAVSRSVMR